MTGSANLQSQTSHHRPLITFRWFSLATAMLATLAPSFELQLPELDVGVSLGLFAISNLVWSRRPRWPVKLWPARFWLATDTLLLTALLHRCGGAMNPFSVYFMVYVVVAALLVDRPTTLTVAVLSTAGFASLLFSEMPHMHHTDMRAHLVGMWLAYGLAAGVVTLFVARENERARQRERAMMDLQQSHARMEKLAQLTTLAAGAAHELGSPLGTIALIAEDIAGNAAAPGSTTVKDGKLILSEVERCKEILMRLRAEPGGESVRSILAKDLVAELKATLGARSARVDFTCAQDDAPLWVPVAAFVQAAANLTRNALEADRQQRVQVCVDASLNSVTVEDGGTGLSDEVRLRLGEPFYSTKPAGTGLGLGVFLAKTLAEQHGGTLSFGNRPEGGARFVLSLASLKVAHAA